MIKNLEQLFLEKIIKYNEVYHCSQPENWPLYCRMVSYIENARINSWQYCTCRYVGKKNVCNVCRFDRDLCIFKDLKLEIKK